jgi:hypothetical protein
MYAIMLFIVSGVLGTILALRLMALEAEIKPTQLTVRGRIVVGVITGLLMAVFVILICGMWWDCDLRAGSANACSVAWGY